MKKLGKITIKHMTDDCPDTSWMGEYGNRPTSEFSIKRENVGWNEYPYFNPPFENYKGESKKNIKKYCQQDYERMEKLNNGYWYFMGIRADVEVMTSQDGKNWLCQHITSGGLWGIESDSDDDYIKEIEQEQINELTDTLKELGFFDYEINAAIKDLEEMKE